MGRQRLYLHQHGASRIHQSGFSLFAAVMPPLWAIRYRLYRTAAAAWVIGIAISALRLLVNRSVPGTVSDAMWLPTILLLGAASGKFAPQWHAYVLRRAGYVVAAEERD
jgi:hypothetical protein